MRPATTLLAAALAATIIAGCGTNDPDPAASGKPVTVEFIAYDMGYEPMEATVPAGTIELTLINEGAAVHNIIIEELGDLNVAQARPGQIDTGTITLEPGTYTLYCDIPGHRSAGMDRTITAR